MMGRFVFLLLLLFAGCSSTDDSPADSSASVESPGQVNDGTVTSEAPAVAVPPAVAYDRPGARVGTIYEVRIISDGSGHRFEPGTLTVDEGDAVRFVVASGGPHNMVFGGAHLSSHSQTQLDRNLSDRMGPLTTGLVDEEGESVTVSFAGLPSADYSYSCGQHSGENGGTITVR